MCNNALPGELKVRLRVSDENITLFITDNIFPLVNEIHEAYRASAQLDSLITIIYAVNPIVVCAMREVIKYFPIFATFPGGLFSVNELSKTTSMHPEKRIGKCPSGKAKILMTNKFLFENFE